MNLLCAELRKVWGQKIFVISMLLLAAVNLFFLYIGTKPTPYEPGPSAYKAFAKEIREKPPNKRQSFIHEKLEVLEGLQTVQRLLSDSWHEPGWREKYADVLNEYEEVYRNKTYELYTDDLDAESLLLWEIQNEVDEVSAYPQFLADLKTKAESFSSISIFQNAADDFSRANIQKTVQAYAGMQDAVEISYEPQKGLVTALDYQLTDLVLLASMIFVSGLLVREERESGLVQFIRSMPGGRMKTAAAKLGTLPLTMMAVLAMLYGVNLAYCGARFGLGDLTRSIQSVPALMRCTLQITAAEYLICFLLVKWIGTVVMGMWIMIAMLWARRMFAGCCAAVALPLANWIVRVSIDPNSHWNVLKYANLASLMRTNELLGNYRNLYWFERPVSLAVVEWLTAVWYGVVFAALFCLVFCCCGLSCTAKHSWMHPKKKRTTKAVTVWGEENRKLYLFCGAAAVLLLFGGYQTVETLQTEKIVSENGAIYEGYMKQLEGAYTNATRKKLEAMQQEFLPLYKAMNGQEKGSTEETDLRWDILIPKLNVFEQMIVHKALVYIKENPQADLVYETGWERLFDFRGTADLQDALWAGLLSCICFSGLFAFEKKGGMKRVIQSTPLGRSDTVKRKLYAGGICAICICLSTWLPRLFGIWHLYGLSQFSAPAMSLQKLHAVPAWVSLAGVLAYGLFGRLVACVCMMLVQFWLSEKLGNTLSALFAGGLLFCLCPMLALNGLYELRWLGAYPLFHLAEMAQRPADTAAGALCIAAALCISCVCTVQLFESWNNQ